jgi:hypothetical protein
MLRYFSTPRRCARRTKSDCRQIGQYGRVNQLVMDFWLCSTGEPSDLKLRGIGRQTDVRRLTRADCPVLSFEHSSYFCLAMTMSLTLS